MNRRTKPYLRAEAPVGTPSFDSPAGWVAEPAGEWHGRAMEVVYDPRRYDVVFLRGAVSPKVKTGLIGTGWEHHLSDGGNQMWVRNRMALAHRRLLRATSPPAVRKIA